MFIDCAHKESVICDCSLDRFNAEYITYRAQVRILREALQGFVDYHETDYQEQLDEMPEYAVAIAALERTK